MATLAHIKPDGPILLDPAQHDLDRPGVQVGVEGADTIRLDGAQAEAFLRWVRGHWAPEFERDLQSLCIHEDLGGLLTTFVAFVTFREDLCCRAAPRKDAELAGLLDALRKDTQAWRAAGVDTVSISGCDDRANPDAHSSTDTVDRITDIADALTDSDGRDAAGASTGERIAGALVAGHPEWGGYTDSTGYTDVPAMIERLGPVWLDYVRDAQAMRQ